MKRLLWIPVAMALLAFAPGGGKIKWTKDYKAALERAKKEGRPMMLYFGADW